MTSWDRRSPEISAPAVTTTISLPPTVLCEGLCLWKTMSTSDKTPYLPLINPVATATSEGHRRTSKLVKIVVAAVLGLLFILTQTSVKEQLRHRFFVAPPLGFPEKIQKRWGQYSPYFPAGGYVSPPEGCSITQVNIVSVIF